MTQQGQGDILAQGDGYLEPTGVDFSYKTWRNYPVSDETMDEKSKKGAETEAISKPTVTITSETSATSADNFQFVGEVSDTHAQMHSLTYELTGGNTDSGTIISGNFLRRVSPPFGGRWRLPVSPISVGQTGLWIRGTNVRGKVGPWTFGTITRTPTAGPVVPCSCAVYEDLLTAAGVNWLQAGDADMAQFTPNGWDHYNNPGAPASVYVNGLFDIGGDFEVCCEVTIDLQGVAPTTNTAFEFNMVEGVKGGGIAYLRIIGDGAGGMQFNLAGNPVWNKGNFGPVFPNVAYLLRFTRTGTTLKAWVWNAITEQWEWDGDPAGATDTTNTWDVDPSPGFLWADFNPGVGDFFQGKVSSFCINVGTKIGP